MNSVDPMISKLVKKVEVLRSESARDVDRAPTSVHFREAGEYRRLPVGAGRAVHYDRIETALVREIVPGALNARWTGWGPRGIARRCYYGARQIRSNLQPPLRIDAPVLDTRVQEPNNIAHLLLDIIPLCLYARRVAGTDLQFLFRKLLPTFQSLLGVFDIRPLVTSRRIEADFVHVCGTRGLGVFDLLSTFDCASITSLPDVYGGYDFAGATGFERIFLARRGARALSNHAEVEALLAKHGYQTIFMEDYPLREQLSIGARARHVVGVHGAAMAYLTFGRGVESVIELMPHHVYHEMFATSISPRVPHYHLVVSDYDRAVAHSGWPAVAHFKSLPFSVDLTLLEGALADIH